MTKSKAEPRSPAIRKSRSGGKQSKNWRETNDQELIITALRQSGVIIAEHLEPGNQIDANETIARLIAVLDRQDLAQAMDRLEGAHGLRLK